ncbi:hypothetical protein U9M48_044637 [Paspalum notatum var. saurae]|uniref:Uncharacterized protein n=1 Tax=Paspalum notatum var. saurae TaxID=547442 RepID=A0AAQ3UW37_PASNO
MVMYKSRTALLGRSCSSEKYMMAMYLGVGSLGCSSEYQNSSSMLELLDPLSGVIAVCMTLDGASNSSF